MFDITAEELKELINSDKELIKHGNVEGLLAKLKVDPTNGLNSDIADSAARVEKFGGFDGRIKHVHFVRILISNILNPVLIIIALIAIISIILSFFNESKTDEGSEEKKKVNFEWLEGTVILIIVITSMIVNFLQEFSKQHEINLMRIKLDYERKIYALRNGILTKIPIAGLLVGDICHISCGDIIPVDGIIINSNNLKIDEYSINGMSSMQKSTEKPWVFSGTRVIEGEAKILVLAIGENTQAQITMSFLKKTDEKKKINSQIEDNKIYDGVQSDEENETDDEKIEKKSSEFIPRIYKIAVGQRLNGFFIAANIIIILLGYQIYYDGLLNFGFIIGLFKALIIGISVLIASLATHFILEATTTYTIKKMHKENCSVRHKTACEMIGKITRIFIDKTGTLTTNQMKINQCYVNENFFKTLPNVDSIPDSIKKIIEVAISINSDYKSYIKHSDNSTTQIGNKTECALLEFIQNFEGQYATIRKNYPTDRFLHVYSNRMSRTTCIPHPTIQNAIRVFIKGDAERILSKCKYMMINESVKELNNYDDIKINVIDSMSNDGLRTVCIAYKDFVPQKFKTKLNEEILTKEIDWENDEEYICSNMTCVCICSIENQVRDDGIETIRRFKNAGISVCMLTGDNLNVARYVAQKCGIIDSNEEFLALDSRDFNDRIRDENGQIEQEKFDEIYKKLRVLARATPSDKYLLVKHTKLTENDEIVAMTADGTNDLKALKIADVGIAMGKEGTDAIKEAADIILLDDNISSIFKAVLWSRNLFYSISKHFQNQFVFYFTTILYVIFSLFNIRTAPLKAIQILWIKLAVFILTSIDLFVKKTSDDLLKQKLNTNYDTISKRMIRNSLGHLIYGLLVIVLSLILTPFIFDFNSSFIKYQRIIEPNEHFTLIFNVFALMTLFNQFNFSKINDERNVFNGPKFFFVFYLIWFAILILHVFIMTFINEMLACTKLSIYEWIWCFALGIGTLLFNQIIITIPVEKKDD